MSNIVTPVIADAISAIHVVSDVIRIASDVIRNMRPFLRTNAPGVYEVENFEATLFLHDRTGHRATYRKFERVRFTRDEVRLLSERSWGRGRQFLGHRMTHGRILEHRRVGAEERHFVELKRPGQKGKLRTLSSTRVIRDGFTAVHDRWLETAVDHRTKRLAMRVVFPAGIRPQTAHVTSLHAGTRDLIPKQLVNGGSTLSFLVKNPPIGERYTISWGAM